MLRQGCDDGDANGGGYFQLQSARHQLLPIAKQCWCPQTNRFAQRLSQKSQEDRCILQLAQSTTENHCCDVDGQLERPIKQDIQPEFNALKHSHF